MQWKVEQTSATVATIRVTATRAKSWEQWILLSADRHMDHPLSNLPLQKRHLELAVEREAACIDCGDLLCGMQGKHDPRGKKGDIRPENDRDDYYDSLIDSTADFLKPYAANIALLGKGNHELSIKKHRETDLTRRLVRRLNGFGSPALVGGYRGWVRFNLTAANQGQSINLYYTHGSGGNSPVTKGVIRTNRRAAYVDADIIVAGHIHEAWQVELCRVGLTALGNESVSDQLHLCIPTYKEEFTGESEGFHHEKEGPPKPIGAWWLRFFYDKSVERFRVEAVRAK
jgi:hypothetical protein